MSHRFGAQSSQCPVSLAVLNAPSLPFKEDLRTIVGRSGLHEPPGC